MRDSAARDRRVTALLGPTNTGKTHHAIAEMLKYRSGVIGLPLRLLAREVYDRVVAKAGVSRVALITGEERIVPDHPQYWVATTEAMPQEIGADFVCVDEIQLCADPERGHVFTDRLLNARGLKETLFLGAETMRGAIAGLVSNLSYTRRDRFSTLTYTGQKKISRMPARSAIVAFSVENVYSIAELIRRHKGGCAVVMGALSPRTRNAQVALYQNGDVDYLVATDAIGMGLNLDIHHVAFASTWKFDGHRMRPLDPQEIAQIAGRAGRHTEDGTFGVTAEAHPFDESLVAQIESHSFAPVKRLMWRNSDLDFSSTAHLIGSLEMHTSNPWLTRVRDSADLIALRALASRPEIAAKLTDARRVKRLWEVCRIPDFRNAGEADHAELLARIFEFLIGRGLGGGRIPSDWLNRAIVRIDRTDGDIDTLSRRLAYIRTWTYVAQHKGWVADESHWRNETRAVEDRLSDALHQRLTQRFVDRRTSVLLRRLKQKETLVAEVNDKSEVDKGAVTIEGQFVGQLDGFRFRQDAATGSDEARTLRQAAISALTPEFILRADRFYNAPDTEIDFTDQGGLMWGDAAVGRLVKGAGALKPTVAAFVDEDAPTEIADKVARRLQHFLDRKVAALFDPLIAMQKDESLDGLARGFAFQLVESMGILPRNKVARDVKELDQTARSNLRKHGVRFGQYTIFMPAMLKPAPTRLRLVLWALWQNLDEFPDSPPPGLVTIPHLPAIPNDVYILAGYHPAGERAIRIDMLERLADLLRGVDSAGGFEASLDMLSITGMTLEQFANLLTGLGYHAVKAEREKIRQPAPAPENIDEGATGSSGIPQDAAPAASETEEAPTDEAAPPEIEIYYTFNWQPRPRHNRHSEEKAAGHPARHKPASEQRTAPAKGHRRPAKGNNQHEGKAKAYSAHPRQKERPIDPDNPFAALMALKGKV